MISSSWGSARTAVALMIGGGYVTLAMVVGLHVFGSASYPLAFGLDHWGDRPYPFPDGPLPVLAGVVLIAAGLLFGFVLVRAAQHEVWALHAAVGAFLVLAGVAAGVSYRASDERRCATIEYSQVERCMPQQLAAARDFVPVGVPALLAAALLSREPLR